MVYKKRRTLSLLIADILGFEPVDLCWMAVCASCANVVALVSALCYFTKLIMIANGQNPPDQKKVLKVLKCPSRGV